MVRELLENLGLTKTEITVYLKLLEINTGSASEIAERAKCYKKNVYDALERLVRKGLVSYAKEEHRRVYHAASPEKLLEFLDVKKREIQGILPQLSAIYHSPPVHEEMFFVFKGKNGVKSIFEDIIKSKVNYDKLGSEGKFKELFPYYYNQYQDKKRENNIACRVISNFKEKKSAVVTETFGKIKFLSDEFLNPATTIIYGHKVAIVIWKDEPIGVLMNSQEVANSYRYYFELLWKLAEE